jgi:hypothetical protein
MTQIDPVEGPTMQRSTDERYVGDMDDKARREGLHHDVDLLLGQILLAGHSADVLDDLLCWRFPCAGFLSNLRSLQRLR